MNPSDMTQTPTQVKYADASRFLVEARRRPDVLARLHEGVLDLDDLVALGDELGFHFDGPALQQAFRNDFLLRLAIRDRAAGSTKANA